MWPLTAIAAPVAVALGIINWKRPLSLVRRNRWRMALGISLAFGEIGLWIWGVAYVIERGGIPKG
jgi:hypothetical protein